VELMGRYSNHDNVTALRRILAGPERDHPPARTTRSRQFQRRLDDQELAQLLAAYEGGVMINDLAEMFGLGPHDRDAQPVPIGCGVTERHRPPPHRRSLLALRAGMVTRQDRPTVRRLLLQSPRRAPQGRRPDASTARPDMVAAPDITRRERVRDAIRGLVE